MMKNLTEDQKSQSYFFICIVVGVGTIMILCSLLVKFSFDNHIENYHNTPTIVYPPTSMQKEKNQGMESNLMEKKEMSEDQTDSLFDEGDALENEDMVVDDASELEAIEIDDITLQ